MGTSRDSKLVCAVYNLYENLILVYIQVSGLRRELPENVHLLTVQLLEKTSLLLRLEHMFAVKEDTNLSTSVTFDVKVLTLEMLLVIECCVLFFISGLVCCI